MKSKTTGKAEILTIGMWQVPYKAINVLCPDGVRRTCKLAHEPDTFFTIPASVSYKGKTVTGFIMSDNNPIQDIKFCPYKYGKNGALFDNPFSGNSDYIVLQQFIEELDELWQEYVRSDDYSHYAMLESVVSFDGAVYTFLNHYKYKDAYKNVALLRDLYDMHFPPQSKTRQLLESLIVENTPK